MTLHPAHQGLVDYCQSVYRAPAPRRWIPSPATSPLLAGMKALLDGLEARPSDDEQILAWAFSSAFRADCTRRKVGGVVLDAYGRVIGTGRNGAPPGAPGCWTDSACPRGQRTYEEIAGLTGTYDDPASPGFCVAIHCEANCVAWSDPVARRGGTIGITDPPCPGCSRILAGSGVARVIWPGEEWLLNAPRIL